MGGCVVSCMASSNAKSEKEIPEITVLRSMGTQSVEVQPATSTESAIYRSPSSANIADLCGYWGKPEQGVSMIDWVADVVKTKGNNKAMAYRPFDKEEKGKIDDGKGGQKDWTFIHLKKTEYITYTAMWDMMAGFARGLAAIGLQPGKSRVALYEETRAEWLMSCYGIWMQGMTVVTVYSNLGEDALQYAIHESEVEAVVVNGKQVKNLIRVCGLAGVKVPKIIYTDTAPIDVPGDVEMYGWHDFIAKSTSAPTIPPKDGQSTAMIMYTSGTTGDPKGVVLTHANVVAAIRGLGARLAAILKTVEGEEETYCGYLPLAHILEFSAESLMLTRGAMVGYGNPRTLTNTSARPHGDIIEFKPLVFAGVPRIYDTIKKGIEGKLPPVGSLKRNVFERAYADRKAALEAGKDTPYWNEKVFKTMRDNLGGRVRAFVSGGAPISAQTHEFVTVCFSAPLMQGYGLTETASSCTVQRLWDNQKENVGGLISTVEVKLRDTEAYKHTDAEGVRGEVCIRGPTVAQGYYRQEEKTKEVFADDGWFYTGDVGHLQEDGTLKLVGRVKALAKNSHGEYIAMEALESTYVLNSLAVPNGVCIIVNSHAAFIGAIVVTDEAKATNFAKKHKLEGKWPDMIKTKEFEKKAIESFAETAKAAKKKPFEFVKAITLVGDEWTPENGVMTAAMKLKRRIIDEKYAADIERMFKE